MADDYLQKVKSGDPLIIHAATFNSFIDAALDARFGKRQGGGAFVDPLTPACEILVKNSTGSNLAAGYVVRLTDWVVSPVSQSRDYEVRKRPVITGETPNASTNLIAILSEAIPSGQLGHAVVQGIAVCDVLINDAGHNYAEPINGNNTKLSSATTGPVRIIAKESSGSTRRAIVKLDENGTASSFTSQEVDTNPSTTTTLKFPNTSLTDNGDGTVTVKSASATEIGFVNLTDLQILGDNSKGVGEFDTFFWYQNIGGGNDYIHVGPNDGAGETLTLTMWNNADRSNPSNPPSTDTKFMADYLHADTAFIAGGDQGITDTIDLTTASTIQVKGGIIIGYT